MSLMSLLIALAAERYLSSSLWQFNTLYLQYVKLVGRVKSIRSPNESNLAAAIFIAIPVLAVYVLIELLDDGLLNFLVSTLILIVCFGCVKARDSYKNYLLAAFRGEATTCEMHHMQLQQDTAQPDMSFGQLLVWLNYRYFIAIMFFFVVFGAPGAVFYRLLVTFVERQKLGNNDDDAERSEEAAAVNKNSDKEDSDEVQANDSAVVQSAEQTSANIQAEQWLFIADWLPVRIVAFGYMLVGHFSKALPIWLESIFDFAKAPYKVLSDVAEKSEDFMIDKADCTAEPCLLVRLAKRTLLLCLAFIALLILSGTIT